MMLLPAEAVSLVTLTVGAVVTLDDPLAPRREDQFGLSEQLTEQIGPVPAAGR
jgi:hypothetical protein